MKHPEDELHIAAVRWFNYQFPLLRDYLHHSPNEGSRSRKVNKYGVEYSPEASRLKKKGTKPGFPDIAIYYKSKGFSGIAIELKAGKGKLSDAQIGWLDRLTDQGWFTACVDNLDEFIKIVTSYLK